ncbi:MAG: hypothetical protein ACI9W2_003662 [Gammaproteobacteria bacterium]|jgi:hypothetical protein
MQDVPRFVSKPTLGRVKKSEHDLGHHVLGEQQMVEMLELKGATVTLDAMHCQRETARGIVNKKGDYVLNVKKNQLGLYGSVADLFDGYEPFGGGPQGRTQFEHTDTGRP